jgi:putative YhdH/YhfP family quinone oxidoreductase
VTDDFDHRGRARIERQDSEFRAGRARRRVQGVQEQDKIGCARDVYKPEGVVRMSETFKAVVVREQDGTFVRAIEDREVGDLPDGDVLVRVQYSSLNYKDALSATGNRGVTKRFPHTPGIDAAGEVVTSNAADFAPGDLVTVTSYDLGMNTSGGWGELIRVPADWVVALPDGISAEESMAIGTGGLTAALSVFEITRAGVTPESGEVLVTGATGGVGSFSVAILAQAGFTVVAATGKTDEHDFLKGLGASEVIGREDVDPDPGRPMLTGRWAAVVDTVGGTILAGALKSVKPRGVVTCCGLVASPDLKTTVFPFILRGVRLIGVDCAECPIEIRRELWSLLAGSWKVNVLEKMYVEIGLADLDGYVDRMLAGGSRGRVVVDLSLQPATASLP